MSWSALIKKPSAFLPVLLSLAALSLVLGFLAIYGVVRQDDEGAAARIFQLLIVAQGFIALFFAVRWLPMEPRKGLVILIVQVAAAAAALTPVIVLEM
jgi:hypothetical protein